MSGAVEEVQIFTTVLRTPDNKKVILGNSSITENSITNYAAYDTRRIDMVFGVGYDDDLRLARDVIARVLSEDSRVLAGSGPDHRRGRTRRQQRQLRGAALGQHGRLLEM